MFLFPVGFFFSGSSCKLEHCCEKKNLEALSTLAILVSYVNVNHFVDIAEKDLVRRWM